MLTYHMESRGSLPLYEFLYQKIRQDILTGTLTAHEKLPSKRKLARHLQISVITVENAYAQLVLEGYVYSQEKQGYFVSPLALETTVPIQTMPAGSQSRTDGSTTLRHPPVTEALSYTEFPFSVWARLMRQILTEENKTLLAPTPFHGVTELREAIAWHLFHFRGMTVSPGQIIIGAGTEYLYGRIIQLLGKDLSYAVENPGYPKIARIYQHYGAVCQFIPMDDKGFSVQALTWTGAEVTHVSPSHHYPTGIVMPAGRRFDLLAWAAQHSSRYIIEDDYDSEFRYQGRPIPSLYSMDQSDKVIYINTFSRTISPSIRISYMVLPPPLVERYQSELSFYSCPVPSFEQYTLARFIRQGYFEKHLNRMKTAYRKQRDGLKSALRQAFGSIPHQFIGEDAGLHFLVKVDTKKSETALIRTARASGLNLSFLSEYVHGRSDEYNATLIVDYSRLDPGDLDVTARQMADLFRTSDE